MSTPQIRLLAPDMPTAGDLIPFLRRMDISKVYVNNGDMVQELEAALKRATGGLCVTTTNATVALELVLRHQQHARISQNQLYGTLAPLVLVPTVTYVASAQAIVNAGCRPVPADVDAETWQLTPMMARTYLDEVGPLDCVMPVAAFGSPVDVGGWAAFHADTGIPVVIDAAGALTEQAPPVPGVTIVYSMHATKFWGAGEGGVVCTADAGEAAAVRSMACFGQHGTNAKMSEYHAAVGLASMLRLEGKHERTMRVFDDYAHHLPGVLLRGQQVGPDRGNWTLLPVLLPYGVSAGAFVYLLTGRGIEAKRWYTPFLHEREEFAVSRDFPVADDLSRRLLGLPFHTGMDTEQVTAVCAALKELLA